MTGRCYISKHECKTCKKNFFSVGASVYCSTCGKERIEERRLRFKRMKGGEINERQ